MSKFAPEMSLNFKPMIGITFIILVSIYIGDNIWGKQQQINWVHSKYKNHLQQSANFNALKITIHKNILKSLNTDNIDEARSLLCILIKGEIDILHMDLESEIISEKAKFMIEKNLAFAPEICQ